MYRNLVIFALLSLVQCDGYFTPHCSERVCGQEEKVPRLLDANPLLAALVLSEKQDLRPRHLGFNHGDHLPLNPYLALLLSHYGRYQPIYGTGRGLYGYAAANNYHNNKPFGAYKIFEDSDS